MRAFLVRLSPVTEFLFVIGFCLGPAIFEAFRVLFGRVSLAGRFDDLHFLSMCVFEAITMAVVASVLRIRGWSRDDVPVEPSIGSTLRGFGLLASALVAYWVLTILVVGIAGPEVFAAVPAFESTASVPAAALISIVNPIFEEAIVVGYVFRSLRDQPPQLVIAISAMLRTSYHVYQGPLAFVSILPMGLVFAIAYGRRRNLWPLVVAHGVQDFTALLYYTTSS